MHYNSILTAFLFVGGMISSAINAHAELRINEIMQSNVGGVIDDLNELPDSWVELYNPEDEPVNLSSYSLGLESDPSAAYKLPNLTIEAGGFQLIYCDKEGNDIHTDFRIDSGKGALYLFNGTEVADSFEAIKKMPAAGIAYGRQTEDSDKLGYQQRPTPGAANCGTLVKEILSAPLFSEPGGLYTELFELSLTLPEGAPEGAVILYTLDGSMPDLYATFPPMPNPDEEVLPDITTDEIKYVNDSADNATHLFTAPISISSTTCVRAVVRADGYLSPVATTQSYIFHPREQTLPVVSITGDPDYFYSEGLGILSDATWTDGKKNYEHDWRRPINLEYYELDGTQVINQLCETRVKGGATREWKLKSMAIYANKRFGTKRFVHEFFHEQKPGLTEFKSVEIRNAGQDFASLYLRDALAQRLMGDNVDIDYSAWQPVIIYLNGEYKGIINLRERQNEDNIYTNYDGLEDVDVIENNLREIGAGTSANYEAFMAFYRTTHEYEEWMKWIDVPEYLNWMGINAFVENLDFLNNNVVFWRPRARGGIWRGILKDLDYGLNRWDVDPEFPYFNWIYDSQSVTSNVKLPERATQLFRSIMECEEVRSQFIDKMLVYMGDFLRPEKFEALLDHMVDIRATEYPYFRKLYWYGYDVTDEVEVPKLKAWYPKRRDFMYRHLAEFFDKGTTIGLKIDDSFMATPPKIAINGIVLRNPGFDGNWITRQPFQLTLPDNDTLGGITAWRMTVTKDGEEATSTIATPEISMTELPEVDNITLTPLTMRTEINDMSLGQETPVTYYDLQGRRLGTKRPTTPGVYIRQDGQTNNKIIVR